ncbi:Type VI secretion-associated protein, family [Sulfitobacter noctilucae]|nr:Type VI secretion-associated protein, family [Sulfitobacter noctilucae]
MGKHPGYGDFLQAGVSEHLIEAMNGWLDATLPPLRDQMGEDWGAFWDGAQNLRFWVGRAVLGRSVAGLLHPSRDRVGRRFPLLLLVEGANVPVPLGADVDHSLWDAMADHLEQMEPGQGAAALLADAHVSAPAEDETTAALGPTLWAHHPGGNLAALLASADAPNADRAHLSRSYWWAPGTHSKTQYRAATWLGCEGLPAPQALGWLLGGVPGETEDAT